MSELKHMNSEQGGNEGPSNNTTSAYPHKQEVGQNASVTKDEDKEEQVNGGKDKEPASPATSEPSALAREPCEEKVAALPGKRQFSEEREERETERGGGSQDLAGRQSRPGSARQAKFKWRESMPEGERWRDEEIELEGEQARDRGGSLADSEDDGEEEEEKEEPVRWMPEKAALVFNPQVNIVRPSSKQELLHANQGNVTEKVPFREPETHTASPASYCQEWTENEDHYTYVCDGVGGGDAVKLSAAVAVAAVLFPLMVWGGYALLPFDAPLLDGAPLRVMYTLRCAFFAVVPIVLGVVVQGVARLRYGALTPLYEGKEESREVLVHWRFVSDSLDLFLIYFLQLAVMATYVSQDLLKLVPLLTIVFTFGRLVYWVCVSLGSAVRGVGFGLSFFPTLVMLGANLYFVCSSLREESVFDVAPPTTAPAPRAWWSG